MSMLFRIYFMYVGLGGRRGGGLEGQSQGGLPRGPHPQAGEELQGRLHGSRLAGGTRAV